MPEDARRFLGTLHPATQALHLRIPRAIWPALPRNTAAFDALTAEEEGALRGLLAAIWGTEGLAEALAHEEARYGRP
jgi:hypothetical protein